jgi:GxxExxY protein
MLLEEDLSYEVRGAIYEVYEHLGHGYLEKIYERALLLELKARGLKADCQVPLVVRYKGQVVGEYFADVVVEDRVILELKAQSRLTSADEVQLLNYLAASGLRVGLLVNFAHPKARIKRLVS